LDLPDSASIGFLLAQVCRLHRARTHTLLEQLGLYHGQPPLLFALWEQDGLSHTELAARLHIQPATVTKMVQRMEKARFVKRRADAADQRVSRVYLAKAGYDVKSQVQDVWHRLEEETFAGIPPQEREMLRAFLLQMRENLLRLAGEERPSDEFSPQKTMA